MCSDMSILTGGLEAVCVYKPVDSCRDASSNLKLLTRGNIGTPLGVYLFGK